MKSTGRRGEQPGSSLTLSVVIPVYRSEECLERLVVAICTHLQDHGCAHEVILVNDFSPDGSWSVIKGLSEVYPQVIGVDLRRNFGQDSAILTGLRLARGNYVAVMDDDFQHDPKYLTTLLSTAEEQELDVVYADFRKKQQKLWKNVGSWCNGKVAEWLLDKPKHIYLSPYKLIRKEVADVICQYMGPAPYVDGLLLQATWRIGTAPAEHMPRFSGQSNYSFWKSVEVAARLMFSFSVKPVRVMTWLGVGSAALGLAAAIGVVLYRLLFPESFSTYAIGWASLIVTTLIVGGLQMIFFGVLGEYTGRTFLLVNGNNQTSIRQVTNRNLNRGGRGWPRVSSIKAV